MSINLNYIEESRDVAEQDIYIIEFDKEKKSKMPCLQFPKSLYFIIGTEYCERFTYYGMKTILILYLTQHLLLQEDNAVSLYHFFVSLCYFTTIFGSFIADNYLGKYKTLIIIGAVYTVGASLLSLTSIVENNISGTIISLILIGFGTGGVKACVGPFGGDQIPGNKKVTLDSYFSMFYFTINLGALVSTIVTPLLRANISCNGSDDCYPLAFGVPAILMAVASVVFLFGRRYYIDTPVRENIYMKAIRCIIFSIKTWFKERNTSPNKKLLDFAISKYDQSFINDVRSLYHISLVFLPLIFYWSLYEQMGSRWTLQATQLDREIIPNIFILPDQMFIFKIVLVIIFIIIFNNCIYPLAFKISPSIKPLRRMTFGIIFTFLSFVAAFILQKYIEDLQPPKIDNLHSRVVLVNTIPCVTKLSLSNNYTMTADNYRITNNFLDILAGNQEIKLELIKCDLKISPRIILQTITLFSGQMNFIIVEYSETENISIHVISDVQKPHIKGFPMFKFQMSSSYLYDYRFQIRNIMDSNIIKQPSLEYNQSLDTSLWDKLPKPGRYVLEAKYNQENIGNVSTQWIILPTLKDGAVENGSLKIYSSEVSILYVLHSFNSNSPLIIPLIMNNGSQVSILWQLPQYVLISMGEVLVNIPGLTFSYGQAPVGMKSFVNALWYLCNAFGNVIVIIVAKMHLVEKQSMEYLIFAVVCTFFCVVFAALSYSYPMPQKQEYIRMD